MEITHEGCLHWHDDSDSILLVTEPRIPVNLDSALAGLAL